MNRNAAIIAAGVGVVALVLGWVLMSSLSRVLRTSEPAAVEQPAQAVPGAAAEAPAVPRIQATLYFGSEDGRGLVPVEREIPLAEGLMGQARALVEAQIAAAPPESLARTIPEGTELRGLYVSAKNEAFVDLNTAVRDQHPGGSMNELFTVYTLVNAIITNLPDIERVQLLIDGREVDTLAGHVDLRRPLGKNEALILTP